jgi:hypothetical protein
VIGTAKPDMGKKEGEWLKSLLDYLLGVSGIIQRVTHAAEKQGEPINWNDARRVVTQTLILIYELDNLLSH